MTGKSASKSPRFRVVQGGPTASVAPPSDEALLEAFERGDGALGHALYDRLIRVVEATLYRVLGRRESDHDDLVQAAFEQIVITLYRRKFARACSLSAWASAVTCNVALHALRARRAERRVFDREQDAETTAGELAGPGDAEAQLDARAALDRLRRHLSQMSGERAEALILHDVLGCELSEIAALTGVSIAAAQSRLVRGRHELHARFSAERADARQDGDS
jgi:RNA polymerase sigma-70 factor (ECF subfamily)